LDLSIIIVNYNVKEFLEQCLYSVKKASKGIEVETIIVDNNSVDGSVKMINTLFPRINLIINKKNVGFGTACNQAIKVSEGKHILFLNPDTIVSENSFEVCINFIKKNKDAGAIGVKMINGKGEFLAESKRSLPTPTSAFYKIFGLSLIFPKSKRFGKYQLKYLDNNKTHQVEVISGAFMFVKRDVLEKSGIFDETFFMYGEDIDLSYRIIKKGYKNYYLPKTTIIHFKGESTKKASLKYIKVFYDAMIIFAKKHYKGKKQNIYVLLIQLAIYFRAGISILKRTVQKIILPIIDFISIYLFYILFLPFWQVTMFNNENYYPTEYIYYYVPSFIGVWIILLYFFKGYKNRIKQANIIKAIIVGTIIILTVYSLLPENLRYSRALIIIGSVSMLVFTLINRFVISILFANFLSFYSQKKQNAIIIGNKDKLDLNNSNYKFDKISSEFYNITENIYENTQKYIELIKINKIETLIFDIKNTSSSKIIQTMIETQNLNLEYKILLRESNFIVSSQSIIDIKNIPELNLNIISKPINIFLKRFIDIFFSLLFLVFSPIFIIFIKKRKEFLKNLFTILFSNKTWISYYNKSKNHVKDLPKLKEGVTLFNNIDKYSEEQIYKHNLNYAKNYKFYKDILLIFKYIITLF